MDTNQPSNRSKSIAHAFMFIAKAQAALFLILTIAKLAGLGLSWLQVTSVFWVPGVIGALVYVTFEIFAGFCYAMDRLIQRME